MAKTNLGVNSKNISFWSCVAEYEVIRGVNRGDVIKHSGMSQSNFYKCMKNTDALKVGSARKILDYLKVPEERRCFL